MKKRPLPQDSSAKGVFLSLFSFSDLFFREQRTAFEKS